MDLRRRIFGPQDQRPPLQQLTDAWTQATTGVNPQAERVANEAYDIGYQHGATGTLPVLPPPPEWSVPQPQRSPLMTRILGPSPIKSPPLTQVQRVVDWMKTGETPEIQIATQAGYTSGWLDAQYRVPPQAQVELTTLQKLKVRL